MTELTAKTNPYLLGHDAATAYWQQAAESGKLAHGWIIAGPKGIGKATLAYRIARAMLSGRPDLPPDHSVFHRVASGAHSDLLVVEPEFDEKKGEAAQTISVEQAREIGEFLSLTPGESQWRVVIVDTADLMGTAAANAILKILEEPPPQALLLLVSHHPAALLPTIRSRCAMLRLKPLAENDFGRALQYLYPDMDERRRGALYVLSAGAPGMASEYEEQGALDLYRQLLSLLSALPALDTGQVHAFADQMTGGQTHARFKLFIQLVLTLFERASKTAAGIPVPAITEGEQAILAKLAALHPPTLWALKWQQAFEQLSLAQARHLDYRQVIIVFFHSIADSQGFVLSSAA